LAILLSLCLGLFLGDAVLSLVDESLALFFNIHLLSMISGLVSFFVMLIVIVIYGLMGLTPMIPKRLFLPLTLFNPVVGLVVVPSMIYCYGRMQQVAWAASFCQVILGLSILWVVQGGFKFRWPLVAEAQLGVQRFSWRNLSLFLLINVFVLLPAAIVYLRQLGVVWVIFGVFWAWQRIKASRGAAASHSSRPPAAKGSFDLRLPASGFMGSKFRQHAG
jgi:hypothetical protein